MNVGVCVCVAPRPPEMFKSVGFPWYPLVDVGNFDAPPTRFLGIRSPICEEEKEFTFTKSVYGYQETAWEGCQNDPRLPADTKENQRIFKFLPLGHLGWCQSLGPSQGLGRCQPKFSKVLVFLGIRW